MTWRSASLFVLFTLATTGVYAQEPRLGAGGSRVAVPRLLALDDALRIAEANHPDLRQAQAGITAAEARTDQAFAPLLPQVNASASYQRTTANFAPRPGALPSSLQGQGRSNFDTFNFFNFGLNAQQLFYDFGQTSGRWQASRATLEAERKGAQVTLVQVLFNVRKAYFDARAAKALVKVADDTLANRDRHVAQIQGFVEVGTRPEVDLAQVKADQANAKVQSINAHNQYATAKVRLLQAMGVEHLGEFDLAGEPFPEVPGESLGSEALLEQALDARPEFAQLASQVRAQELVASYVRGAYGPTLSGTASATEAGRELDNLVWNVAGIVNLNRPIFQGGLTRAQGREAQANLVGLRAQLDSLRQRVRVEVEEARLSVQAASAALTAAAEAVTYAARRLELAEGRYQTGVGSAIDLSDAQVDLTSAEAQRVQAEYTLASARATLRAALGHARY